MDNRIELKEFLNFLSETCKVNAVEEDYDEMKNLNNQLNELTSNVLIKRLFDDVEKNRFLLRKSVDNHVSVDNFNEIVDLLKNKLSELLNEGIFDSILTFIAPKKIHNAKGIINENKSSFITKKRREKKKTETKRLQPKNEAEVEIQVYEEDEGLKKVFKCPQNLLVSNMPYFSEINKGRKLEEMDIMVHCEVTTFEWLMKWVKRNSIDATTHEVMPPKLDFKNVISIMSLANFLKMRPLFQDCLHFCKYNMNNVIKFTPNLSCLKDAVLRKLADLFDNVQVQNLKDEEDRIKSRLFSKLVRSLREVEPQRERGHYASSAHLYLCLNCSKLVNRFSAPYIPCRVQYITIKSNGDVIFKHSRDSTWSVDDHVKSIWTEYKNWSKTYWRLWSQCHFLYCNNCSTMYAVAFSDCCPYHPQQPHFHPSEQFQTTTSPIGQYPCCGSRAIRYESVKIRSGCKFRSHNPKLLTNDDNYIQAIVDTFPDLIKVRGTQDNVAPLVETNYDDVANLDILLKNSIDTDEQNMNQGLLNGFLFDAHLKIIKKYKSVHSWECKEECSNIQDLENKFEDLDLDSISTDESENTDVSFQDFSTPMTNNKLEILETTMDNTTEVKLPQSELKPIWTSRYPNRFYNEDNQRDYEEIAFQAISEVLLQYSDRQKCGPRDTCHENSFPQGGSYAKIELEWKEARLSMLGNKLNKI